MTKIYLLLLAGIFCLLPEAGCTRRPAQYHIGVSQCSDDEWRTQMNDEIRREILFHDDADVEIRTADDNNEQQIADIEYFIAGHFDIIIVSPRESKAITPVIRKAYEKGIPVIVFDRAIDGEYFTSYMKLDNEGVGRAAAEYAAQAISDSKGNIIELRGLDDSSPARDRHEGFNRVIDSISGVSVVASVPAYWRKEAAYEATDSLIRLHPDVNLIYAHNDRMALGAAEAIRKQGRTDIKIIGTDAAPALGIKAVADSMIDATFIYPTEGERVIRNAMAILKGQHYDRIDHVPAQYAVDSTNADILLRQNKLLNERTHQMEVMNARKTLLQSRHDSQQYLLIAVCVAAGLLVAALFFMFRYLRQRRSFEKILTDKNELLSRERDHQTELYNRLEEATRSKLIFFTNVSHDLRTPLTLIAEPVEQVAEAPYLSTLHRSMMQMALRNLRILKRMIEQILDFRRYQNGKTELNVTEMCPARYISEWSDAFRAIASRRHITFTVNINASENASAALDVEKLERIFFNIVSNAFKYTPDKGRITVDFTMNDSEIELKVSDTGIGIPEEECGHIFDRFYQVDKVHPKGSGIGLSLTKAFVELMDGKIEVKSSEGKGSVFRVTIPVRHTAEEPEEENRQAYSMKEFENEVEAELTPMEKESVALTDDKQLLLLIDDNPDILTLVQELLGDDYNIITATDGRTGVRLARKYVPDLVICDIMMPGMDGLECCRLIKDEVSTSHVPVLMLTACKLDEQRTQSYDSGADGYISKPFQSRMLKSRVRNLLLNRQRIYDLFADSKQGLAPGGERDLPDTNDRNSIESEFYRSFMNHVNSGYRNSELSVKDIADALGLGAAQLSRKIKALTNFTPVDIIRSVRLREARRLILTTEMAISEIAYEVGFSSPQYFSKCFRDAYGVAPSDLRQPD